MHSRYQPLVLNRARDIAGTVQKTLDTAVLKELLKSTKGKPIVTVNGLLLDFVLAASLVKWGGIGMTVLSAVAVPSGYIKPELSFAITAIMMGFSRVAAIRMRRALPAIEMIRKIEAADHVKQLSNFALKNQSLRYGSDASEDSMPVAGDLKMFDWNELKDPDKHVHVVVMGETGSGKTYLTEKVMKFLGFDFKVITTKRIKAEWQNCEVIGPPRDFAAIGRALDNEIVEMSERMADLDYPWPQTFTVVDELSIIARECPQLPNVLSSLIMEARQTRKRLWVIAHGKQMKLLGLKDQSDLAEGLVTIRLGRYARQHATMLANKGNPSVLEWVNRQKRPMLVDDTPANFP